MIITKVCAPACERNQSVILDELKQVIKPSNKHLLEIGTGTGQHAVFMAPNFSSLQWHTSDLFENHNGINQWIDEAQIPNVLPPVIYESGATEFPPGDFDVIFTANTLHIMSWENVVILIKELGCNLKANAYVCIYGPFNYEGQFTSQSNKKFDEWLKLEGPHRGISDFEIVTDRMKKSGLALKKDKTMPANNRFLIYQKN